MSASGCGYWPTRMAWRLLATRDSVVVALADDVEREHLRQMIGTARAEEPTEGAVERCLRVVIPELSEADERRAARADWQRDERIDREREDR